MRLTHTRSSLPVIPTANRLPGQRSGGCTCPVPELILPVVELDLGMRQQLLLENLEDLSQTRSSRQITCTSSQCATTLSPSCVFPWAESWVQPQCEQHRHWEDSLAPLPHPCAMSCDVPTSSSTKRRISSSVHSQETFQHRASRDEIIRPDPFDGHDCGRIIKTGPSRSHSALVDRAYWKGTVATSAVLATCFAIVLVTDLRKRMSPTNDAPLSSTL